MRHVLPFVCLLAASPVHAQAVDAAGADQLTANLSRYLGSTAFEKGLVTVGVDGDAYSLTIDFNQILALVPQKELVKAEIAPYVLKVRPRGDGTWDVAGGIAPDGSFESKFEDGIQRARWTVADGSFSGVFDPALAAFSNASGKHGAISVTSSDTTQSSDTTIASGSFELNSTKNATQGVDFTAQQTVTQFMQTNRFVGENPGADWPVVIRSPEISYRSGATGFQAQPILDLLAFAVAHADEAKLKAAQPELKTLLRAALPLWQQMTGGYRWSQLSVGTPAGIFGAASAGLEVAMDGVRKDGTIDYRFLIDDLALPEDIVPRWTRPLLPQDIDLNFGGSGVDLEGPATLAIDALDLDKDPPIAKEVGDRIVAGFMANPPKFLIKPSTIRNSDTEISAQGEMTFEGGRPALTATVEAAGFDKAMETIQAASATEPQAQQAFLLAVAAKGFAKTLADGRLQWVIEMTPDGAIAVNGATVKPADPPSPQ